MKPIFSDLLFVTRTEFALEGFCKTLNRRLSRENMEFERFGTLDRHRAMFAAGDMRLSIHFATSALPAANFNGALDGYISNNQRGALSEVLFRHTRHMTLTLAPMPGEGVHLSPQDRLRALRIAHAATTLAAELHHPAAVHWRNPNQLLLGRQYLELASNPEPWALFGSAVSVGVDQMKILEGAGLIDRPILVYANGHDPDECYAAGLSFLRHAVQTGAPIIDGDSFGPIGKAAVHVLSPGRRQR